MVPWEGLNVLINPHYPKGDGGRPSFLPAYGDAGTSDAELVWLQRPGDGRVSIRDHHPSLVCGTKHGLIPDETTILNFFRLPEKYELAAGFQAVMNGYLCGRSLSMSQGTIVDATLINALSLTKNKDVKRSPGMHQTKKGNQYCFLICLLL